MYLLQRTVNDLINGIADKFDIDAHRILQVFHITAKGLHIIVDEDVVRELPEGQDMMVEFAPAARLDQHSDRSQYMSSGACNSVTIDGGYSSAGADLSNHNDALEMWLNF